MGLTAKQVIELLDLRPLPIEGGHFRQTYAASRTIDLGPPHGPSRPFSTAIFYLLTNEPGSFSAMHRLPSDEVYHFYLGNPVVMLLLHPDGRSDVVVLGRDIAAGQRVQVVVPTGTWQGSRLVEGGEFALMGTTMAPGFAQSDYEGGTAEELGDLYPDRWELIRRLSR
jgi:predicted cupin superfamily sugar epimerase